MPAQAKILESYLSQPEDHLPQTQDVSSNMLFIPDQSLTSLYSSLNEAQSIYSLPWLSCQ